MFDRLCPPCPCAACALAPDASHDSLIAQLRRLLGHSVRLEPECAADGPDGIRCGSCVVHGVRYDYWETESVTPSRSGRRVVRVVLAR